MKTMYKLSRYTINTINSQGQMLLYNTLVGKVIALVCFPYDIDPKWSIMQRKQDKMSIEKIVNKKEECKSAIGIDMYMLDDLLDQSDLTEHIITYFT